MVLRLTWLPEEAIAVGATTAGAAVGTSDVVDPGAAALLPVQPIAATIDGRAREATLKCDCFSFAYAYLNRYPQDRFPNYEMKRNFKSTSIQVSPIDPQIQNEYRMWETSSYMKFTCFNRVAALRNVLSEQSA